MNARAAVETGRAIACLAAVLAGTVCARAQVPTRTLEISATDLRRADIRDAILKPPPATLIVFVNVPPPVADTLARTVVAAGGMTPPQSEVTASSRQIFDGAAAKPGEIPWQVGLLLRGFNDDNRKLFCGGSLISPTHVVTAAHCLFWDRMEVAMDQRDVEVLVGSTDYNDTKQGERIALDRVQLNPGYNPRSSTFEHDLAVLTLSRPVKFGSVVPLYGAKAEAHPLKAGSGLLISGWGRNPTGKDDGILRRAVVPTVDNATCNRIAAYAGAVKADMVCAGLPGGRIDACKGDSGGPAVYEGTNSGPRDPVLYGVVSWGARDKCAVAQKIGVYAAVEPHVPWIRSAMKP